MKLFLLMLLCVLITSELSAQGVTKNGASTKVSTTFVSRNSKIGKGLVLDRNGKVYVLASIAPKSALPQCYTSIPWTLTATGEGGTGFYTYQWYVNSVIISGETYPTYTHANIDETSSNKYYCSITSGSFGSTNTDTTTVSVIAKPFITAKAAHNTGQNWTLTRSGPHVLSQYWKGPNGFFSVDSTLFINANSQTKGPYTVTGNSLSKINLITNGDFEAGNTGFTSAYSLAVQDSVGLQPEGTYDIVKNPQTRHKDFGICGDHTSGSGKQMVVNGSPSSNTIVWSATVNVTSGTEYQFSYWVQSVVALNPSKMQLYVNNIAIWNPYTANLNTCDWKQFNYNWNSGSDTVAILTLRNKNVIANGNDFALDDIEFQQVCNSIDTAVVN